MEASQQALALSNGAFTAGVVVATVAENAKTSGVDLQPRQAGIIGHQAKHLLARDSDPQLVLLASWIAFRRGKPEITQRVYTDLQLATSGLRIGEREYQSELSKLALRHSAPTILDSYRARLARREAQRT